MSDADVRLLLREKNIEITKNKLVLDIENNMDSFKQNIENILNLEFISIEKGLKNEFNLEDPLKINKLKGEVSKYFLQKEEHLILLSREFIVKTTLNKNFISSYNNNFNSNLDVFSRDFNMLLSSVTEDYSDDIYLYLEDKLTNKVLEKVNVQLKERISIIINNARETYNKYLLLNKKTK